MKLRHIALSAASALALAACATSTPFQPASAPGAYDGYSQQMITNDRVRVSFGGNSMTDRDTVENSLLFRAAQLTLDNGYDHFVLLERDTDEDTEIKAEPRLGSSRLGYNSAFLRPGFYDPYFGYSFYRPRVGWSRGYRMSSFDRFNRLGYSPYGRRSAFYDPFFDDGYDLREVSRYRATAEAKFGRGPAPDRSNAFDAREVIANLGPTLDFGDS